MKLSNLIGLKTREGDVNGVLIGETLMRAPDKKAMLDELRYGPMIEKIVS